MFYYMDLLLRIVRPRRLLYLAVGSFVPSPLFFVSMQLRLQHICAHADSMAACMHADGVAPRAKMNQQRARRFKSAKAAKEAVRETSSFLLYLHFHSCNLVNLALFFFQEFEENLMRERFRAQGKEVLPPDDAPREVSDPNIITPGTEFMEKLSAALEYYVRARLSSDPRWNGIKVLFRSVMNLQQMYHIDCKQFNLDKYIIPLSEGYTLRCKCSRRRGA